MNLDTIVGTVVAAPTTGAPWVALPLDSFVVRNANASRLTLCIAAWFGSPGSVGTAQIVWPSGHDLVRGVRANGIGAELNFAVPPSMPLRFRAQDPITPTLFGTAAAADRNNLAMLMWYEDLPGVNGRLINTAQLRQRGLASMSIQGSLVPTAAGVYSGAIFMDTPADLFQPDSDYAIIGAAVDQNLATSGLSVISIRGVDSGSQRCSIPGRMAEKHIQANWFSYLSDMLDLPTIPVFNSGNRGGVSIDGVWTNGFASTGFTLFAVLLDKPARSN